MFENPLLRFARQLVQQVIQQEMQQIAKMEQAALQPMQSMIQQVVGGAWIGNGADAFVNDVTKMMIPGVQQINQGVQTHANGISHAVDVIDKADRDVQKIATDVGQLFHGVFSG
jgi:uncharacterized protein YukE